MMPLFDVRCIECFYTWVEKKAFKDPSTCPDCGSGLTCTPMPKMKRTFKAKDPYDMINDNTGSTKKIKSFAKDHRKGGRG